jgi:hypothetical protein
MTNCDQGCQVTVGTTVTGVTLFCGIMIACCALFIRFFEPAPVLTVVQENPVAVASATQRTMSNNLPARQPESVTIVTGLADNPVAPLNIVHSEKLAVAEEDPQPVV